MLNGRNLAVSGALCALAAAGLSMAFISPDDGRAPLADTQTLSALVLQPVNPRTPPLPIRTLALAAGASRRFPPAARFSSLRYARTSLLAPLRSPRALGTAELTGGWRSVPNRNANPLNIKLGAGSREYVRRGHATISEIPPADGGRFLRFRSPATGFRAAVDLLTSRPYRDLSTDAALRRWSSDGYGAEILGGTRLDGRTRVRHLTRTDFTALLGAMAAAEGYRSASIGDEIATALGR